jgi:hypothetical protein
MRHLQKELGCHLPWVKRSNTDIIQPTCQEKSQVSGSSQIKLKCDHNDPDYKSHPLLSMICTSGTEFIEAN